MVRAPRHRCRGPLLTEDRRVAGSPEAGMSREACPENVAIGGGKDASVFPAAMPDFRWTPRIRSILQSSIAKSRSRLLGTGPGRAQADLPTMRDAQGQNAQDLILDVRTTMHPSPTR